MILQIRITIDVDVFNVLFGHGWLWAVVDGVLIIIGGIGIIEDLGVNILLNYWGHMSVLMFSLIKRVQCKSAEG